jgi:hypothetical protein
MAELLACQVLADLVHSFLSCLPPILNQFDLRRHHDFPSLLMATREYRHQVPFWSSTFFQ